MFADYIIKSNCIFDSVSDEPFKGFIAVAGDKIAYIGRSDEQMAEYLGGQTQVLSYEDQLVMPGHTKVCNPRGHVMAEQAEEAEGVLHVELDLNEVVDYRQRSPYLRDRRPDLYDLVLLP